jgi:hypothetical protein
MVTFCWLPPDRRRTLGSRVDLEPLDGALDAALFGGHVDDPPAAHPRPIGQGDVLADRALHEQGLRTVPRHIHEAGRDGISGVPEAHLGPIHEQLATGRPAGPREDAKELILPLPLQAYQPEHLASPQLEGDIRELRAEAQFAQLETRRRG